MLKSNNQTYIHLYTDFSIHQYICDRSLSGDPLHIVNPFLSPRAYPSVIQHTFPTKSQLDSPSICPYLIQVSTLSMCPTLGASLKRDIDIT